MSVASLTSPSTPLTPSASSASASSSSASSSTASSLQSTFLQLLVTQLQNQDPTNPLDSAQMTSQLAEINTVSGISQLNTTLQALETQLTTTQQLQASALLGQSVLAPGSTLTVSDGTASAAGVQLSGAASDVSITIRNSAGVTVQTLDLGAQAAGVVPIAWNGTDAQGQTVADGAYSFTVNATSASSGTAVTATALSVSTVDSVVQQAGGGVGVALSNGQTVAVDQIAEILSSATAL